MSSVSYMNNPDRPIDGYDDIVSLLDKIDKASILSDKEFRLLRSVMEPASILAYYGMIKLPLNSEGLKTSGKPGKNPEKV